MAADPGARVWEPITKAEDGPRVTVREPIMMGAVGVLLRVPPVVVWIKLALDEWLDIGIAVVDDVVKVDIGDGTMLEAIDLVGVIEIVRENFALEVDGLGVVIGPRVRQLAITL